MPGGSRSLPGRPSLRHLKLEAKRRLAAGEFPSLHEAQVAIAWEHGLPSWAALKQRICDTPESHALVQLRWVMSRFSGAVQPGWTAPAEDELRLHFDEHFLSAIAPPALIATISSLAADLRGDLVVLGQTPLQAHVQLKGMQYIAVTEAEPPHRLTGLRGLPVGSRVHDPRIAQPPVRTQGQVPAEIAEIAEQAFAELGLTALLLAGGETGHREAGHREAGHREASHREASHREASHREASEARDNPGAQQTWVLTQGWADLDRREPLDPGHRFPAPGVTVLVTTTAVLRLVAEGRVGLDLPANDHLRAVRLADDTITVRELLSHTVGVDSPTQLYADQVPELAEFIGPVISASGSRGTVQPSNGGCAVLGQLLADVTGMPYADAAARLVLAPLKLTDSSFPARAADIGPRAVTGYNLSLQGTFEPIPARIPTLQAVAGLWSTGADLVRLGLGWSALLPEALAHEALTPQTGPGPGGGRIGLGWIITAHGDVATQAGTNLDATASVTTRIRDQRTHVVLTSRMIPVNSIESRLLRAWTNPALTEKETGNHMYQPYPAGTQMPEVQRPPAPPQVVNAVRAMYVGAAASILGIVIDILTVNATKTAIEKRSRHLTASQVTSAQHVLVIAFIVGGVIAAAVWIFLAKSCQRGQSWARITGTVLFALATVDTRVGLSAPLAGAVKLWALVTWLAGLIAVIFLWQRPSTAFFKGIAPS